MNYGQWEKDTSKSRNITFKTAEEAVACAEELVLLPSSGTNHLMVFEQKDGFSVYDRENQPCYGEMRTYGKECDYPESIQARISKPGDLHDPFPKGTPIWIGTRLSLGSHTWDQFKFLFDPEISPYRKLLPEMQPRLKGNELVGIAVVDTEIPPTPFIQLLIFLRNVAFENPNKYRDPAPNHDDRTYFIARYFIPSAYLRCGATGWLFSPQTGGYALSGSLSLPAYYNGHLYDLDEGRTFKQRQPYNRKQLSAVFGYKHSLFTVADRWTEPRSKNELDKILTLLEEHQNDPVPESVCGDGNLPAYLS